MNFEINALFFCMVKLNLVAELFKWGSQWVWLYGQKCIAYYKSGTGLLRLISLYILTWQVIIVGFVASFPALKNRLGTRLGNLDIFKYDKLCNSINYYTSR